jgi:hypothetical protein
MEITTKTTPRQNWRNRQPVAHWTHGANRSAVRKGIISGEPCGRCGAEDIEARHPDCSRPLLVMWPCRRCHKALHKAEKRDAARG